MPLPLCLLLLLLSAATAALPPEGGPAGQDSAREHLQEAAEMKNSLLTFLAWRYARTSQARAAPFMGGAAGEVSRRQEGPPPQQSARPDKVPCKNFFWKTFSSCK
ncbi:cortistatin [Myotis daubentonii]|uniref:cortistatin n=1 Tax=Myotis daubentonii TaxID=98922 RepID=UPI002873900C|nr:cortistatin [Myotis daubentonii]